MAKISQDEGYRTKFLISFLCIFSVSHFIVSFIQPVDETIEKKDAKKIIYHIAKTGRVDHPLSSF